MRKWFMFCILMAGFSGSPPLSCSERCVGQGLSSARAHQSSEIFARSWGGALMAPAAGKPMDPESWGDISWYELERCIEGGVRARSHTHVCSCTVTDGM